MSEHVGHRGFGILHYPQDRAALFMGGACVAEGSTLAVCAASRLLRQVQDAPEVEALPQRRRMEFSGHLELAGGWIRGDVRGSHPVDDAAAREQMARGAASRVLHEAIEARTIVRLGQVGDPCRVTPRDRLLAEYQSRHGYPHPSPDEIPEGWGEPLTPEEAADFSARHVAAMEANRAARIASVKRELDELEGKPWS